jgi:UDP:flavonoid glycosyltransferase YjiC (YdhE family)
MNRPRVMLANEFGAGRGHIMALRQVALCLGDKFSFQSALCRREYENNLVEIGVSTFDGPGLIYHPRRRHGPKAVLTSTWGEFLGDLGFDRENRIEAVVEWWLFILQSRKISLFVADYAPMGLLAARCLGIPTISVGQGYGLPPWQMPEFPVLNPKHSIRLHDEAKILASINRIMQRKGGPSLSSFPEIYRSDCDLVQTLSMLDPYRDARQGSYLPPSTDISDVTAGAGDEVFIYFSTQEINNPNIVKAVAELSLPRRGFLPAASPELADMLTKSGMIVEPAPMPANEIARRSRMIVSSGQHGMLCLGLFAGLPQVCMPQHNEQDWHARAAEREGVAKVAGWGERSTENIRRLIETTYHDTKMFERAAEVALALRSDLTDDPDQKIKNAVAPIIAPLLADVTSDILRPIY